LQTAQPLRDLVIVFLAFMVVAWLTKSASTVTTTWRGVVLEVEVEGKFAEAEQTARCGEENPAKHFRPELNSSSGEHPSPSKTADDIACPIER
jgi:hypothetical protein